jgi:iron complex outermembrane recepter protein
MNNTVLKTILGMVSTVGLIQATPALAEPDAADQSSTANQTNAGQSAAPSTNAPPARAAEDTGLTEIIVTARRVEERLQDVPISITVFNQQQLANRNVVNAQDLATYTPSLSANNNFGSANSTFAIRGFVQDIGTQPSVGVYFADVVSPRGASNNEPIGDGAGPGTFWDLQNVQVLKGPQGTLFGRNTTGGAILVVPQKPTSTLGGYIETSFGNDDMKRIQAVGNLPVNDDVRLRVGVDHQSRDGYLNNDSGIGPPHLGDVDYTAVRASLVVDVTPDLENYTIASYMLSDTTGDVQKLIACNPSKDPANFLGQLACAQLAQEQAKGAGFYTLQSTVTNPDTRLQTWQIIDTATWRASDDLTVKNIVSYAQLAEKLRTALFGTNFFLGPGLPIDFANSTPLPGGDTADESTTTEEFQLQGRALDGKLNYQSGAYAEFVDPLALVGSQSPVLLDCTNSDTFNCISPLGNTGSINYTAAETRFRNYGLYSQGTYTLTDQLKLTGGVRYTWDRVSSDAILKTFQIPTPGVGVPYCTNPDTTLAVGCAIRFKEQSSAPTGLVDLDYTPTEDVLVYGKYSRGYRAGGVVPSAPTLYSTYQPEHVDTYESGIKTTFHEVVNGTFDVAVFYNNFSNQQLQVSLNPKVLGTVTPASGILNAGKSRIYGAEVESSISPVDNVTVDVSYTYLATRIQQVTVPQPPANSPYLVQSPIMVGDSLTLAPKNKYTVTGTYRLPVPDTVGHVAVAATFTHTGAMIANYVDAEYPPPIAGLSVLPALNLLNLNLNWTGIAGTPFDLGVFATNVTNRQYLTFVPGLYQTAGFETASLGQPRFYGARLRYTW